MKLHNIKHTALYNLHQELHANLTSCAGYAMPLHYPPGITQEHVHTRKKAGLFDLSHMGQIHLTGSHSAAELEKLTPSNIESLPDRQQRYTVLTNKSGGIIDDFIISNLGAHLLITVNAERTDAVLHHLHSHLPHHCQIKYQPDQALLALQGPHAITVLERYDTQLSTLPFMHIRQTVIKDIPCWISRSGYTGEDGFEIFVANHNALQLAQLLLTHQEVQAIGLGARESLRQEAALCLYGHEISPEFTAVEANLSWLVAKDRSDYLGSKRLLYQLREGAKRYRVGVTTQEKNLVREGSILFDQQGKKVGHISSSTYGASVQKPVAMAYVATDFIDPGSQLTCRQQEQDITVTVTELPFIKHRYYKQRHTIPPPHESKANTPA